GLAAEDLGQRAGHQHGDRQALRRRRQRQAGLGRVDAEFVRAGLKPEIILTAMDADVIKTYVELGLGVGILASIAMDDDRASSLRAIDARNLFSINPTSVAVRRGALLRGFAYEFIQTFASHLTRPVVEAAQRAPADTEQG